MSAGAVLQDEAHLRDERIQSMIQMNEGIPLLSIIEQRQVYISLCSIHDKNMAKIVRSFLS
ncbi:hypothetical protein C9426_19240 [Serratia sp. S1B]|nr:hypothetical protein C9426_19240 [Serratia sp. S1B]